MAAVWPVRAPWQMIMNTNNWNYAVLLAGVVALAGCGQAKTTPPPPAANGVVVDIPKLQQAFATTTDNSIKEHLAQAAFGVRYGDYAKTLTELDKLTASPGLTEPQKQVVAEVIGEVKQVLNKPANPPQ